jgi:hypothetical protein
MPVWYWQQRMLRISRKVHLECRRIRTLSKLNWSKIMFMEHQSSLNKRVIRVVKKRRFGNFGFVVPCIFKYSNKTPNQTQQPVVKFIA